MNIAAILLPIGTTPDASRKWVIQSGILGELYVVRVRGRNCGRGQFVEARHYLTPWRCQARKFETAAEAEAFAELLEPAEGQSIDVKPFEKAWHEEVMDDRWHGTPKIAPTMPDHGRPLLEIVRLYATALEVKLRLAHIMPAALPFIDPKAVEAASPVGIGAAKVGGACEKLHAWRERLLAAGVPTTTLLIIEGTAAKEIASETQELGSKVIAIGAQHEHQNNLLGGWLRDDSTQEMLHDAPCPVLISEAPR